MQICFLLVNVVIAKSRSTHGLDIGLERPSCSVCTPLAGCGARARVPAMRGLKTDTTGDTQGMALDPWGQRILIFGMYDSETMRWLNSIEPKTP